MLTHSKYITKISLFFVFLGTVLFLTCSSAQGTNFQIEAKKIEKQTNTTKGFFILATTIAILPHSISSSIKLWNFYNQQK